MTKTEIVEKVTLATNLSKKESAEIVENVFGLLKSTLVTGCNVKISGFGNFEVKKKAARNGRNPQTGAAINISARRVITFKPSQVLKRALNGGGD